MVAFCPVFSKCRFCPRDNKLTKQPVELNQSCWIRYTAGYSESRHYSVYTFPRDRLADGCTFYAAGILLLMPCIQIYWKLLSLKDSDKFLHIVVEIQMQTLAAFVIPLRKILQINTNNTFTHSQDNFWWQKRWQHFILSPVIGSAFKPIMVRSSCSSQCKV